MMKLDTLDLQKSLEEYCRQGPIIGPGKQRLLLEHTVAFYSGLKFEIFSDEHPPPHFHVTIGEETASFGISDCKKLEGKIKKWEQTIQEWHSENKQLLIDKWNSVRPSGCTVGKIMQPPQS
jgi:hypothetical protein